MSAQPIASRHEAEKVLRAKAAADPTFRADLLANPADAASRALGVPLPKDVTFTVLQETDRQVYLVLPVPPEPGEMSDADLESVAGGLPAVQGVPPGGGNWGKKKSGVDPTDGAINPGQIGGTPFQGGG